MWSSNHHVVAVTSLLLVVVVVSCGALTAGSLDTPPDPMWMDGLSRDVDINCPSLRFIDSAHFNPAPKATTMVRCRSCELIQNVLTSRAQRVASHRGGGGGGGGGHKSARSAGIAAVSASLVLDGDDTSGAKGRASGAAGNGICQVIYDLHDLRQHADGSRAWATRSAASLEADKQSLLRTHLVPNSGAAPTEDDLLPLRFHTPRERRMLPCARYFLRDLCYREVSANEEKIEECLESASLTISRGGGGTAAGADARTHENGDENDAPWVVSLRACVGRALGCSTRWCNSRLLAIAGEQDLLEFSWFEGAFGNDKFAYVADGARKGRNVLNPYRRGGEMAAKNPWLNGTWKRVEESGDL